MTADLVAFLRARHDETAAKACAAAAELGGDWYYDDGYVLARREGDQVATGSQDYLEPERGEHIACHDPARVLANIDAKRELIKRGDTLFCECDFADSPPTNPEDRNQEIPHHYDCTAYRIAAVLALPYADHPDYRKEWRP